MNDNFKHFEDTTINYFSLVVVVVVVVIIIIIIIIIIIHQSRYTKSLLFLRTRSLLSTLTTIFTAIHTALKIFATFP